MKRIDAVLLMMLVTSTACSEKPPLTAPENPVYKISVPPNVPPGPPADAGKPLSLSFVNPPEEMFPGATTGLEVRVVDKKGTLVAGRVVSWTSTGGGSFDVSSGVTDAAGLATTNFTSAASGSTQHVVTASAGAYSSSVSLAVVDPTTLVGTSLVQVPRADSCNNSAGRLCESVIGNLIADAMRAAAGTDFAIVNSGSIRADLTCSVVTAFCPAALTVSPYGITRGTSFSTLPFGNRISTLSLSGAELRAMLENSVGSIPSANGKFAQVSGLCFEYRASDPSGSRVVGAVRATAGGSCTSTVVDLTAASSYTLAQPDFTAAGGDGYANVVTRSATGEVIEKLLRIYVSANSPVNPSVQGRIACIGVTGCP